MMMSNFVQRLQQARDAAMGVAERWNACGTSCARRT